MGHRVSSIVLALSCVTSVHAQDGTQAPYPRSTFIIRATWDFSTVEPLRKAPGSDLWPCTWAHDDELYCAWGDGGGFNGSEDRQRASLGFARVEGAPDPENADAYRGTNIWGTPPGAEHQAVFGGKVGSIIAVNDVLYATGGFFTTAHMPDPVTGYGVGPRISMIWSDDLGRNWQLAPWASRDALGSFLNFGKNNAHARDDYVYLYYQRAQDAKHVFLKRVPQSGLKDDPAKSRRYEYFAGTRRGDTTPQWSHRARAAKPVFMDENNVEGADVVYIPALDRYLLTAGHNPSGAPRDWSAGQLGVFEAPHPWGPWSTVDYQEDWGGFGVEGKGDYLGLRFPTKWISADGKMLWGVFSSLRTLDSFNVVKLTLETQGLDASQRTPTQ